MKIDPYQHSARLLRALSHPIRLRLLQLLDRDEECVCHLTALTHKRQAYVSQQLAALRRSHLVRMRKEGLRVYYRADDARTHALVQTLLPRRPSSPVAHGCGCPKCNCAKVRGRHHGQARSGH